MNKYHIFLVSIVLLFSFSGFTQENTQIKNKIVKGWEVETGYFFNSQPYAKVGNGAKVLIQIEALSWDHKPPEGFILKFFLQQNKAFFEDYTVYLIGRKPNLPDGYSHDQMSCDYGSLIGNQFKTKVDIVGVSTGGAIGLCLAANFPELINKTVIISSAFRVSDEGKVLEKKAVEYFGQKRYGKTMATMMEVVYNKGLKRFFNKLVAHIIGPGMLKGIQYPNDFQVEVMADISMDFENRLKEIKIPTMIIVGEKDIGYSFEDVKITAAGIKNSELLAYEQYGHDLYTNNYKEVNISILNFLK